MIEEEKPPQNQNLNELLDRRNFVKGGLATAAALAFASYNSAGCNKKSKGKSGKRAGKPILPSESSEWSKASKLINQNLRKYT